MIRTAVLTISDSAHAGARVDLSGPAVAAVCAQQGWSVRHTQILPDEQLIVAEALRTLADSGRYDLILTTGGTGITTRDITPEATHLILQKELPGLAELMREEGLRHTRRAVLSRSLAGTRAASLIINLPGSPKGAPQSLGAIVDLIPHIVELLRGNTNHDKGPKLP